MCQSEQDKSIKIHLTKESTEIRSDNEVYSSATSYGSRTIIIKVGVMLSVSGRIRNPVRLIVLRLIARLKFFFFFFVIDNYQ